MSAAPRRRLSSLAKTAVVSLMLLIAAGLLTPAILQVRERSNLMFCSANLQIIGMAAHDYHSAYDRFPPGWFGPNPDSGDYLQASNHGVLQCLHPYYEADNVYKFFFLNYDLRARTDTQVDPKTEKTYYPPTDKPWWTLRNPDPITLREFKDPTRAGNVITIPAGSSNFYWAQCRLKLFHCPSDDPYSSTEGTFVALHTYGPDAPNNFLRGRLFPYSTTPSARELGRTNYVGVAGTAGKSGCHPVRNWHPGFTYGLFEGIFYNRSDTTLGQLAVQDGASNILMFGETLGGVQPATAGGSPERRYSFSWMCGALPTYYGLYGPESGPWYAFSSRHRKVVQFVKADGSVIGLHRGATRQSPSAGKPSEDWRVLQEMAGKRDGGLRATNSTDD